MILGAEPRRPAAWRWLGVAAAIYAGVSVLGICHGASLRRQVLGAGGDPYLFIWCLAWWPWALARHIDPFTTQLMWQPLGVPMLWATSVPLLALLLAPVTAGFGAVLAYNLLILAAPVASALAAYVLCRYICRDPVSALLGGFVFGFSSYEMAADLATPNLSFTALLPCLVLLALARLQGRVGRRACVALAAAMMVAEFFISIEIFATAALFGGIAWGLAYAMLPPWRARLRLLLGDAAAAGAVTALVLSPALALMWRSRFYVALPAFWPLYFTADLANLLIPSAVTWAGGAEFAAISQNFTGVLQEQDAYLGAPLALCLLLFAAANKRQAGVGRFLTVLLLLFLLLSLGPFLTVAGRHTNVMLPGALLLHLPLLASALPARFAVFVSLVGAMMLALWVAAAQNVPARYWRLGLGLLACLLLLPAPHLTMPVQPSVFFRPGEAQRYLGEHARVLVLPFGSHGPSSYWQVENRFGFAQSGGYLGYPPAAMQHFAVVEQLFDGFETPHFAVDLQVFCAAMGTAYIVAGDGTPPALMAALNGLGWNGRNVDDVTIFTVPVATHG